MQVSFEAMLQKFGKNGDKTGWTYFDIPAKIAEKLHPGVRVSYRVKGRIDEHIIRQVAILPMGEGIFIMPFNAAMRKATRKQAGDLVIVKIEYDNTELEIVPDFLSCLADDPEALAHFNSLPKSHQQYYSKWIDSAKTDSTRTRRIAIVVNGLARKMDYGAMLREQRDQKLTR